MITVAVVATVACWALQVRTVHAEPNFGVRFEPQGNWMTSLKATPKINGRTLEFIPDCDVDCCKARCDEYGSKCRSVWTRDNLCYLKDLCLFEGTTLVKSTWSTYFKKCVEVDSSACDVSWETYIGNGYCDDFRSEGYNSEACDWDGGDCCAETCTEGQYYCKKGYGYRCRNLQVPSGKAWDSSTFLPGMFKPS
mmetsp:Transcript_17066/g.25000  ORF Transcript_17066/g.25000 Transcript_17066/m.25000 type:complete len:194 (-) Transcript_17066:1094-1675(-)